MLPGPVNDRAKAILKDLLMLVIAGKEVRYHTTFRNTDVGNNLTSNHEESSVHGSRIRSCIQHHPSSQEIAAYKLLYSDNQPSAARFQHFDDFILPKCISCTARVPR